MLRLIFKYGGLIVLIAFIIAEIIINPIGEFPLNDDWAYARAVYNYVHFDVIKLSNWQTIPLLPQLVVGSAFCKLFGFSFTLLRFVSLISFVGVILIFNQILKSFSVKLNDVFILLLTFVFSPLSISLANTYMPEISILLVSLLAFFYLQKYIQQASLSKLFLFTFFSVLASLTRQTGIVLSVSFAIVFIWQNPKNIKNSVVGLLPFLINALSLFMVEYLAKHFGVLPSAYNYQFQNIVNAISHPEFRTLKTFAYYFLMSCIGLGLFMLPLTISNYKFHGVQLKNNKYEKYLLLAWLLFLLSKVIFSKNELPFVGNMFYPRGVGPVILSGFNSQELAFTSLLAKVFCVFLTIFGGISFFVAAMPVLNKVKSLKVNASNFIISWFVLFFLFYLAPICLSYANDRYLLFLLPFFILIYFLSIDFQPNKFLLAAVSVLIAGFSIATTHDYLSINRVRWKAANYLTEEIKVNPNQIDAGFEFNCWHLFENYRTYDAEHKNRWWCIEDDTYIVSPKLLNGYEIEKAFPFSSWVSFDFNKVYVLKRSD